MDKKEAVAFIASLMEVNEDEKDKTRHTRKQVVDILKNDYDVPLPTAYKWVKSWEIDSVWVDPENKKANQALQDKNLVISALRHMFCQAEANEDQAAQLAIGKDLLTAHKTARNF